MGDKIKDRKLGSQEEKNMSRLLIKIIWFILGVAALIYGIKGIYFCFTGGINRDKRDKREEKE